MIVVINGCTIDIAMMRKPPKTWQELPDTKRLVSITTDHTLKSGMKGNFHVPFGIGGGWGKIFLLHTDSWISLRREMIDRRFRSSPRALQIKTEEESTAA